MSFTILIIAVITNVLLALFVYNNNPKSSTNRLFLVLSLLITFWLVIMYLSVDDTFATTMVFWARMSLFAATPMNCAFFLFADTFPDANFHMTKKLLVFILLVTFVVMLISISPFAFTGIVLQEGKPIVTTGPGMLPFAVASFSFLIGVGYLLIKKSFKTPFIEQKQQIRMVGLGMLLMLMLLFSTVLIPVLVFKNQFFIPFAPLYTLVFLGMTAYAIIRHGFLDIRLILIRAISYLFFILLCSGVYSLILFVLIQRIFGLQIELFTAVTALIFAIFAALTFQPVLAWLRHITNLIFFKGVYDSNKLLGELTRIMAQTIEIEEMASSMLKLLVKEMKLTKAAFLLVVSDEVVDAVTVNYQKEELISDKIQESFAKSLKDKPFNFEEIPEGKLKKLLRKFDIFFTIPIRVDKINVAVLVLGPKLSGEIYTVQDVNFLNIFASQAGIAIQNAQSYQEIKKFSIELERRVEARTHELKESQERELTKAQDIAKLKDEFVFVASHELRTPVTAIKGFLELISTDAATFPKDIQENLHYMAEASEHLNQLINDLLEIARADSGEIKMEPKPTDLVPIIQSLIQELSTQATQRKVQVNFSIVPNTDLAVVDENKIKEVIMNLLSNAIKYNHEAGSVDISIFPIENKVMLEVRDTGYGIPKDQQAKIFQKFFRATTERSSQVMGTGLGLFITQMLVEKMGGTITFTSVEGKGTTFALLLRGSKSAPPTDKLDNPEISPADKK